MNAKTSMYNYLISSLASKPLKPLLAFEGTMIKRETVLSEIDRVAAGLITLGVKSGDTVGINLPNVPHAVIAVYAINKIGAIANIIHPLMPTQGLIDLLKKADSKYLFTLDIFLAEKQKLLLTNNITPISCSACDYLGFIKSTAFRIKTRDKTNAINYKSCIEYTALTGNIGDFVDDESGLKTAVLLHSGGTTGQPKTIELSNLSLNSLANSLFTVIDRPDALDNSVLMVLPLFHGFGLGVCMHTCLSFNFTAVLMPSFNAEKAAKLIKKYGITLCAGVPNMYDKLLKDKAFDKKAVASLRYVFCGGDKLSESIKKAFDKHMRTCGNNCELLEGYGLTEVVTVCTVNRAGRYSKDSVGEPLDGIELKIIGSDGEELSVGQKGEICVTGDTMMKGYLNDDEATAKTLIKDSKGKVWVHTGDYGYLDEEGKLYFVERLKRLIKISGVNVFPAEIERLISSVYCVKQCCVIDNVDENNKIKLEAYVVLKDEFLDADKKQITKDILDICKAKLMKYSVPSTIAFKTSLPTTLIGKVDFKELKN